MYEGKQKNRCAGRLVKNLKSSETYEALELFHPCSDDLSLSLLSALGDPVCSVCVFHCSIQTAVHRSHGVGVSDHFPSGVAVCAQAQQEADFLHLASRRG